MRRAGAGGTFGQRHRQDAVAQIGGDAVAGDGVGELEGPREVAVTALDLVVVPLDRLGNARGSRPSDGEPVLLDRELDLLAHQTRQLRR